MGKETGHDRKVVAGFKKNDIQGKKQLKLMKINNDN